MTPISRKDAKGAPCGPTVRITNQEYRGTYADARGRKLVISLLPGDVLCIRPARTRRPEYMTLSAIYDLALRSRVLSERMTKINAKRRRKQ